VNPRLNAVVRVLAVEALAEAEEADRKLRAGEAVGPLHGVPITTKINTDQRGCPTDNGIRMFKDLMATEDAPVIANLRGAGAIVIGRTNAPAFSTRGMTDNALHGMTRNPWHHDYTCGGSSGGAGSAVAAGIEAIGQGNDIGGSVRWPAYCNGVVGLRPTIGRIPSYNPTSSQVPRGFSSQLMSVQGPLTRTVRDARLALAVMAQGSPHDPVWVPAPLDGPPVAPPIRVALVAEVEGVAIHPAVSAAVRAAGAALAAAGYRVEEIAPPDLMHAAELWHPIGLTEIGARLRAALDQAQDPGIATFVNNWWELKEAADLPGYIAALQERDSVKRRWQEFQEEYPIIVMPSCAEPALPNNMDVENIQGSARMLEALRFQMVLPLLGLPGLAVPVGSHEGLPLGVQVVSRKFREDLCLAAGEVIEAHEGVRVPIDPVWA
jgi:amidase